ncbi:hypothetical protein LTS18_003876 [Coniosporium uncinatum]|uniref:Uncharacterized protein n=1 Tax=Coniosporium uncinatum TaxID=93489 RepID=A0ACC3D6N2_9PEZI|nr:hypothetical protein LTS18_003876 [Coniosporium uncinatum]
MATPPTSPQTTPSKSSHKVVSVSLFGSSDFQGVPLSSEYFEVSSTRLGSGAWSDVFAASSLETKQESGLDLLTPPATPTKSTFARNTCFPRGEIYAVKKPASRSAKAVNIAEAKTLTFLHQIKGHEEYLVYFRGIDPTSGHLVLDRYPLSLEDYINQDLNKRAREARTTTLMTILPTLTKHLVTGLAWIHNAGIIHADIKPSNILLEAVFPPSTEPSSTRTSFPYTPLYADFSASLPTHPPTSTTATANDNKDKDNDNDNGNVDANPATAGGTWDFLAPELLTSDPSSSPRPSPRSDIYALGVTLLFLIVGRSPYADAPNVFLRREMARLGKPMQCIYHDERFEAVARGLTAAAARGVDGGGGGGGGVVIAGIKRAVERKAEARVEAGEWADELL